MKVIKRDGRECEFDISKIVNAITSAMAETEQGTDFGVAIDIANDIEDNLDNISETEDTVSVEDIQDSIEELLAEYGRFDVAKTYILYRAKKNELREKGWDMTELQQDIYDKKYRYDNETFPEFLDRVSGGNDYIKKAIRDKRFLPAGRILAGRGLKHHGKNVTLSNCYVMPKVEDNIESIFDTAKYLAKTYSYGGGCGINISNLRPMGSRVQNSASTTTGATSFMDLYSMVTGLIGQKGRRGALMINIDVSHPDIEHFIDIKNSDSEKVRFANISINITDDFMRQVVTDGDYELKFEVKATGEVISKVVKARELFRKIAENNHKMAEPGQLYKDKIDSWHLMSHDPTFEYHGVNPCFTGDMKLLTPMGYKTFEELEKEEDGVTGIVNVEGKRTVGKVWCNGEKETVKLKLSNREEITCTPDHVFLTTDYEELPANMLEGKKLMPYSKEHNWYNEKFIKLGFIQGDGSLSRLTSPAHMGIEVNIGVKDYDIRELFKDDDFTQNGERTIYLSGYNDELRRLGFSEKTLPYREFPSSYNDWSLHEKASFLQGCYSANGSVIKNHRIAYKTTSLEFAKQLLETLSEDFGINAYMTTNKARETEFDNGTYLCRESYDVNISRFKDVQTFSNEINFYHKYKKESLSELIIHKAPTVTSITDNGIEKVYDFTEPLTHWGIVEGFVAHNCAEEPLPPMGSCNLSSINLSEFVLNPFTKEATFNFDSFGRMIDNGVQYLNEVLDDNMENHPLEEQKLVSQELRQIGLGLMGFADMLIKLGIRYGSPESIKLIHDIGFFMINRAIQKSAYMAKDQGSFPRYDEESVFKSPFFRDNTTMQTKEMVKKYGLRNSQVLTIAPTGSISTMIGVSGGLEPIFQISYTRKSETLHNEDTYYKVFTPIVKEYMELHGLKSESELPEYFVTSSEIPYRERINVQAIWQRYIDASISSTVNLPEETTVEQVQDLYEYAWSMGLKGVTIYRDNCMRQGILTTDKPKSRTDEIDFLKSKIDELVIESLTENPDVCPMCGGHMNHAGGCEECQDCGYSPCSI